MATSTTNEMDGLISETDINNRHFVMKPCSECMKYSQQDLRTLDKPCQYCGGTLTRNGKYWYSLRTWRGDKKLTAADKKKLGGDSV